MHHTHDHGDGGVQKVAPRRVIALLLNNAGLRDDYQGNLRRGVEQACVEHDLDLWVYVGRAEFSPSRAAQLRVFRLLSEHQVDGLIVGAGCIATGHPVEAVLETLRRECPVPTCIVGLACHGVASIVVNNRRGAAELAEHLIRDHDRTRVAFIGGPPGHEESEQRLLGLRDALEQRGLSLEPEAIRHGDFMPGSGAEAASQLLAAGPRFDAIMAANDGMARGALDALALRGLVCPEDVVVVGFDDTRSAAITRPALTTVRQPVARMGALAVSRIKAAWRGHASSARITLATSLVTRESCGCRSARPGTLDSAAIPREATHPGDTRHVARLLAPVLDDAPKRRRWARVLLEATAAEQRGEAGALPRTVGTLLSSIAHPLAPTHELHRVITALRSQCRAGAVSPAAESSFHDASALVASESARRDAERIQRHEAALEELRKSGEQLATRLTLEAVARALLVHLPRFEIKNALIALYADDDAERLVPVFGLVDGLPLRVDHPPYSARMLMPPDSLRSGKRKSLTVMPLTFEHEELGVAVLDLPPGGEESRLLREQIGGAIKAARLHEDALNQERLRAQAQEERRVTAERLRSLQLIAGGVAHDLNNALGPMVILPDTIRRELEHLGVTLSEDILEDLATIRRAAQRAAATIRDLLTLGQPAATAASPVDLNRFLRDETTTLRALCENGAQTSLQVVTSERPLTIQVSKPHLVRALSNLVLNAVDATQGEGSVTVRASGDIVTQRLPGIEPIDPGAYAVLEVEDTGCGIAPENLRRVLEPFFTARRRPGSTGSGLGLTIVQRFVKEAGGYLRVDSRVGQGTTFALYFPALVAHSRANSERPAAVIGGCGRVLVVDDEAVQLRTAQRILTQLGYEVATASSGAQALELFAAAAHERPFDLVVVDVVIPDGMGGVETGERIRALRSDQPLIMASGSSAMEMGSAPRPDGAAWLSKPYSVGDLAAAVQDAMRGRTPLAARCR